MPLDQLPPELVIVQQTATEVFNFLPRLVAALVIFVVFYFIDRIVRRMINRYTKRAFLSEDVRSLLVRTISLVIITIGIITALGTLGIDVTALVAGLGLTGFALGFALQDIISNFLAGVLLVINRPFRRGNYIKVGDKEGIVVDLDLRYTTLQRDQIRILIPNSTLFKEAITILLSPPSPGAQPAQPPAPTMPAPPSAIPSK